MSLFNMNTEYFVTPDNEYSFGLEVEFFANNLYILSVKNKFKGVLGIDGAYYDNLGEYRSPVFHSKYPFTAFRDSMDFTEEAFKLLIENNFLNALCPVIKRVGTMGIHFTIGGKFLKSYYEILYRSKKVQSQLKYRYIDYQKQAFREDSCYRGNFNCGEPVKIKSSGDETYSGNGYNLSSSQHNRLESKYTVVEFRFFPSCRVNSIISYLYYILFDGVFPGNEVVPYYRDNIYYE